jgi:hypothetical protein
MGEDLPATPPSAKPRRAPGFLKGKRGLPARFPAAASVPRPVSAYAQKEKEEEPTNTHPLAGPALGDHPSEKCSEVGTLPQAVVPPEEIR